MTAASAVSAYQGQQANYKAAKQASLANADNARSSVINQYAQDQLRMQQNHAAASSKLEENEIQRMQAHGTAQVAAGEAGVHGLSVERLMQDYYGREGRFTANVSTNLDYENDAIAASMEGQRAGAQNQINSMPMPTKPSFLDAGLRIAKGGVDAGAYYVNATRTNATRGVA